MLTAAQQGILVVAALSKLPNLGDYINKDMRHVVDGCCPNCCAQCGVLQDLDRSDMLDEVITWAPNHMWHDMLWWRNGQVDRTWLYAVWDCQNQPRCDTDEFVDTQNLDYIAERLARQLQITAPESYARLQEVLRLEEIFYRDTRAQDDRLIPVTAEL